MPGARPRVLNGHRRPDRSSRNAEGATPGLRRAVGGGRGGTRGPPRTLFATGQKPLPFPFSSTSLLCRIPLSGAAGRSGGSS